MAVQKKFYITQSTNKKLLNTVSPVSMVLSTTGKYGQVWDSLFQLFLGKPELIV